MEELNKSIKITPEERRRKNNEYIKNMGIECFEKLPVIESSDDVKLRDLDVICRRAIACLLSIQLACDIHGKYNYEESKTMFYGLLKDFGVENDLLECEKKLFEGQYDERDVINVTWSYECYWSLVWALGLIDDEEMKVPSDICDCNRAIDFVKKAKNIENFKGKTKLRDIEEVLDMLDLYYRYHWACVEKRVNPRTNIGVLNPDVVWERRKGLEWLISNVYDWNQISLDT